MNKGEAIAWQTVARGLRGDAIAPLTVAEAAAFLDYRSKLELGAGLTSDTYSWQADLKRLYDIDGDPWIGVDQ